jgi:4-hydroxy-tetrahydrodipicolinate reductase
MSSSSAARVRLAVIGATGRMGCEILSLAGDDQRFEKIAGVARGQSPLVPLNCASVDRLPVERLDVVIDFSQPELFNDVVDWCVRHGRALVSGVTGLTAEHRRRLETAAQTIPVLWAPNMSLGIAVMAEMFGAFSRLNGFEFQIEEAHHKHKKDKPSGTALFLQERLQQATGRELPEPLALRGGGIFGIHKVWAMGEEEIITLEHTAMNRKVFARGALQAAFWIRGRRPGLYKMGDVLRD